MDLSFYKTISFFILCVGSALVFAGTVGTRYFGNRLEAVRPYRQPILTATAMVEVAIVSSEDIPGEEINPEWSRDEREVLILDYDLDQPSS